MNECVTIASSHSREAAVYLRQFSAAQDEHNREPKKRQCALMGKARDLGSSDDRIIVIVEDLCLSGSCAMARSGVCTSLRRIGAHERRSGTRSRSLLAARAQQRRIVPPD